MNKDTLPPIMRGDDFTLKYIYKPNGTPTEFPQGFDFLAGLYRAPGDLVYMARLSEGSIERGSAVIKVAGVDTTVPALVMHVSHDVSVLMLGDITMETTVLNDEMSEVKHAGNLVKLHFEERYNNDHLGDGGGSSATTEPSNET